MVAAYLGVSAGEADKRVARLLCAGGDDVAPRRAAYQGHPELRRGGAVGGGGKGCAWGCLGYADCAVACTFDAISMNAAGSRWWMWRNAPPATTAWSPARWICSP
jgi:Na+-translocating ferredoxin:NAD+ oxidoreductase subunit B